MTITGFTAYRSAEYSGSFQETAPRKTAENTIKHRGGGAGSVVANHCGGGESSMVVTTLLSTCLNHTFAFFSLCLKVI